MKNNSVRRRIRHFLKSEEGRVGVKSPLTLGVASASVLLAQAIVTPPVQAHLTCIPGTVMTVQKMSIASVWCDEWSVDQPV